MTIPRRTLSSLVASQLPEFVREDNQTFVAFIEAYYEYLQNTTGNDLKTLGDLDTTLDSFVKYFKKEVAINFPQPVINERFLLQHMKDHYLAKGSEASFKFLFRVLFDKDVTLEYPSRQMLRASDGRWNQDVSIFARVNAGDPDTIIGRVVDVVTPNRIIRLQIDRRQYVEVEIDRIVEIADGIYEFFIDRKFFGDISPGDRIRYEDTFDATILSTTSKVTVQQKGKRFKLGDLYEIKNGDGAGSILKVSGINDVGGINAIEFVKYGINYTGDFTATILPLGGQSATSAGSTSLTIGGASPSFNVALNETTNGFFEQGIINTTDYNTTDYWDGTYVGDVVREFFVDNKYTILDPDEPAIIKITLGSLAKYPGYYTSNLGFLDDAIYIQDSRFYQAFSYVIKIDEKLEAYRSAVKTLIHPAGMALFGEYDIRNEFDTGTSLTSMLRFLVLQFQDEAFMSHSAPTFAVSKPLATHYLFDGVTADTSSFSLSDTTGTDAARTVPYLTVTKPLDTHYLFDGETADTSSVTMADTSRVKDIGKALSTHFLNDGETADTSSVSLTETTYDYDYDSLTRIGISAFDTTKVLNSPVYNHYLNDGSTLDTDTVSLGDALPNFEVEKALDTHYLNGTWVSWTSETAVVAGSRYRFNDNVYTVTVSGVTDEISGPIHTSGSETNGTATFEYLGLYNEIADTSSVTMNDTLGTNGTRTVPFFVLNKELATHYLYDGETEDTSSITMADSGGSLWLSPYTDPYPSSGSYFANDSGNYTTGESTFTG
jgi:hypothetical protein